MPESSASDKDEEEELQIEEFDPTGRYGRSTIMLGKGAFKKVYKAIDKLEGIEVAWNQIKVKDVLRNEDDLERLYSEVHLLQTLKHKNIIKFYCSWVDPPTGNINFITEVFTSGNLRQYRKRYRQVDVRAVKNWSRQILHGLLYLHSHDPPVIHRDLKCDNIFVNGNHGEVKIGDLGLAAILLPANSARTVLGTPEFMAPELYNEEYNELIDIYAFGMCLLELMTLEYPYCECSNAAQIFRKVTSGVRPASLVKVKDPDVKLFIEKCIANVSERLSARELLMDPFLQQDVKIDKKDDGNQSGTSRPDGTTGEINAGSSTEISSNRDFMVEGQRKDVNTIFLKLRIADSTGHIRNIHFPFDIEADTSISVASEMVAELSLTNQDVSTIAAMIDSEIQCHIPEWVAGDNSYDPFDEPETKENLKIETEETDSVIPADPNQSSSPGFILERLPSGKRYWSDSPRDSSDNSPTHGQPNISSGSNKCANDQGPSEVSGRVSSPLGHNSMDDLPGNTSLHDQENSASFLETGKGDHHIENLTSLDENEHSDVTILKGNESVVEDESDHINDIIKKLKLLLAEQEIELIEIKKKHKEKIVEMLKELPIELQSKILTECKLEIEHNKHDNIDHPCVTGEGNLFLDETRERFDSSGALESAS